jgi:hypothetical protein
MNADERRDDSVFYLIASIAPARKGSSAFIGGFYRRSSAFLAVTRTAS